MNRTIKVIGSLSGLLVSIATAAQAQGWYNYTIPGGQDLRSGPVSNSYEGFYVGPWGDSYYGSVRTFSMDLGSGVSMGFVTSVSNSPGIGFSGLPVNPLAPGFALQPANYANGLYSDPATGMQSNATARLSVALGGGFSMNFLGAVSTGDGNGFYLGPGSGFDNRMSTMIGTGFSMNLGHAGTLSLTGGVSQSFGRSCGPVLLAGCH